jgi:hypothetical protein
MDNTVKVGETVWFYAPTHRRALGWRAATVKGMSPDRKVYQYTMLYLDGSEVQFSSPFCEWHHLSDTLFPRDAGQVNPPSDHLRYIGWRMVTSPIRKPHPGHVVWQVLPTGWQDNPADPYGPGMIVDGKLKTWVGGEPHNVKHSVFVLWDTIRECAVVFAGRPAWNGEADPHQIRQAEADPEVKAVLDSEPVFQPAWNIPASSIQYVLDQPRVGQLARVVSDKGGLDESPFPVGTEGRVVALVGWTAHLKTSDGKLGIHDARNLRNTPPEGFTLGGSNQAQKTLTKAWKLHPDSRILPNFRGIAGQTGFAIALEKTTAPKDIWKVAGVVQSA